MTEAAAAARRTTLARLRRVLTGDLGTIVAKSLAHDPAARYASVQHLADDLAFWAKGEPIHARTPSLAYRASRLVRRHWVASTMVAALALALVGATIVAFRQAATARTQTAVAQAESAKAKTESAKAFQLNRFLTGMLTSARPVFSNQDASRIQSLTVRELLDRASGTIQTELGATPEVEAVMQRTLGQTYAPLGALDQAEQHFNRAIALFAAQGNGLEAASTQLGLSKVRIERGQYREGEVDLRRALEYLRVHEDLTTPQTLAAATANLAVIVTRRSVTDPEGSALYRESLNHSRKPGVAPALAAQAAMNLGVHMMVLGDLAEAEALMRDALRRMDELPTAPPERNYVLRSLSELMRTTGDYAEAVRLGGEAVETATRMLPPGHPWLPVFKTTLGRALASHGQADRAEPVLRDAYAMYEKSRPAGHQDFLGPLIGLGSTYRLQGRLKESERVLRQAQQTLVSVPGLKHLPPMVAGELGLTLRAAGRTVDAVALLDESYTGFRALLGDAHPSTVLALARLRGGE